MKSLFVLSALLVLTSACATRRITNTEVTVPKNAPRVSVMTFNVENLFDFEDDPSKNDEAFLPSGAKWGQVFQNKCRYQTMKYKDKDSNPEDRNETGLSTFRMDECLGKDWSPRIVRRKFERITDVVKQVENGRGPDILLLQEVENRRIVERWNKEYLQAMGYTTLIHLESPDERGIDVAILSRLEEIGEAKLHLIDFSHEPAIEVSDQRPTRGILEGRLKLPDGTPLAVFSLHFPSQGASTLHRSAGLKTLKAVAAKVEPGTLVIAGGDFNITSTEEFKQKYYRDLISDQFYVSHQLGCAGCPGTTYYSRDNTWSFFDVLLFSKPLMEDNSPWKIDPSSIKLVNSSRYQIDHRGSPAKFRTGKGSVGVSDHWPMYAEIYANPSEQTVGAQ